MCGSVCVCVCVAGENARVDVHLTEQAITNAAGELLRLRNLVGDSFLFIQLLGERLQLGQGELEGKAIHVALRRVL